MSKISSASLMAPDASILLACCARWAAAGLLLIAGFCSCAGPATQNDAGAQADSSLDLGICLPTCNPDEDEDKDLIPNGVEGCQQCRDTDGDGVEDWQDGDSDGDGIPDQLEAGLRLADGSCGEATGGSWPCDSDEDGLADYLDLDSDGDSLPDSKEQYRDGNDHLGCCLQECGKDLAGGCRALLTAGCGPGQSCVEGSCHPPITYACSLGETSPTRPDTFADGIPDAERGTWICSEPLPVRAPLCGVGNWQLALPVAADFAGCSVPADPQCPARTTAAVFAVPQLADVALGFISASPSTSADLASALEELRLKLAALPGVSLQMSAGSSGRTHEGYDLAYPVVFELTFPATRTLATLLGQIVETLAGPGCAPVPAAWNNLAAEGTTFRLRTTVIRRFAFKKDELYRNILDEEGLPSDSGQEWDWRLVVAGTVALRAAQLLPPASQDLLARLGHYSTIAEDCMALSRSCAASLLEPASDPDLFLFQPVATALRLASGDQELEQAADFWLDYSPAARRVALRLNEQPATALPLAVSYWSWAQTTCGPD